MRFTQMRSQMEQPTVTATPDYQVKYLSTEVRNLIDTLSDRFVEHLTRDITQLEEHPDYKSWLGNSQYATSNGYAKEAISICPYAREIYGIRIRNWTDNALKCYDVLLIHYIQNVLGEKIRKQKVKDVYEGDVYQHLINKGGKYSEIGERFKFIYKQRSDFQHVQVEDPSGLRRVRNTSNKEYNRIRDQVLEWFEGAVNRMTELGMGD